MPPPTRTKKDFLRCRLKSWRALLSIIAALIYATTLFIIVKTATIDRTSYILSLTTATHPSSDPSVRTGTALHRQTRQNDSNHYKSVAKEIAAKWNLTSPEAPYLLEQQFYRAHNYNPKTDFLHFHHIPKTGGTSISKLMDGTLGALVEGHRGILPGSQRSGSFDPTIFYALNGISQNNQSNTSDVDLPYLASYGHTRLRPIHGPNKTKLASFFEDYFNFPNNSPRRLRSLAMLREPMDLRASNYAMAMCSVNGKVDALNVNRSQRGLEPICTPEEGLNISKFDWNRFVHRKRD